MLYLDIPASLYGRSTMLYSLHEFFSVEVEVIEAEMKEERPLPDCGLLQPQTNRRSSLNSL